MKRLLLLPFFCSTILAYGQEGGNSGVITERQSAGSVNEKGFSQIFSPNLYDGTANIHIPVFEYEINGLNLGVSLNYDTHGIKVDAVPSSTGIGWALSTGGSITRKVQGIEDEVAIYSQIGNGPLLYNYGTWFHGRGFSREDAHVKETEYDLFTVSMGGRSFDFTINVGSSPSLSVSPKRNIKVEAFIENSQVSNPVGGNSPATSSSYFFLNLDLHPQHDKLAFKITDETGNNFIFTRGDYQTKRPNNVCVYYAPTKWLLKEVITATGQRVKYTYGTRPVYYRQAVYQEVMDVLEPLHWSTGTVQPGVYPQKNELIYREGEESYITKIEYSNGTTLNFDYHTDQLFNYHTHPLKRIRVTSSDKLGFVNKKSYEFDYFISVSANGLLLNQSTVNYISGAALYSNFVSQGLSSVDALEHYDLGTRLMLNKITVLGNDDQTRENYYSFDYNQSWLPRRLHSSQDYYGYYNGKTKSTSIPSNLKDYNVIQHTNAGITYGVDKTPDLLHAQAGVLKGITNATRGSLEIKYKDHSLQNPQYGYIGTPSALPTTVFPTYEQEQANDGLCIDEVIIKDGYNNDHTTRIKYEFSGGERFFRGGFSWFQYGTARLCNQDLESRVYTNSCITPMDFINGSNHGYSNAEVKKYNAGNQLLGSTKYHFTNLMLHQYPNRSNLKMNHDTRNNNFPVEYFYKYRMGQLLDVSEFDRFGNETSRDEYGYKDYFSSDNATYNSYRSHTNKTSDRCAVEYWNFVAFPYLLNDKKESVFTNNGVRYKETDYAYTADRFDIQRVGWSDENGIRFTKDYFYSYNRAGAPGMLIYLDIPVATELARHKNGTRELMDQTENSYQVISATDQTFRTTGYSRLYNNELMTAANVPGNIKKVEELTKWDDKGNVLEKKLRDRDEYMTQLWDNRTGKITAAISKAKFEEVAYTSFEGQFEPINVPDFNKGNWYFNPAQVVMAGGSDKAMTGRHYYQLSGTNTVYTAFVPTYGKKYTVSVWATAKPALSLGGTAIDLTEYNKVGNWYFYAAQFTGNGQTLSLSRGAAAEVRLDELRLYPQHAAMVTTTYEPLFGPGSNCDARNNIVYYEYDAMGRQTITRDINGNILKYTKTVIAGDDQY